jgi:hypothetical protein
LDERTLRRVLELCDEGRYGEALDEIDQQLRTGESDAMLQALMARVAALAGDPERLGRATLWLTQKKGQVEPELAAEGFYWRGDLVSALRTLEAAPEARRNRAEWYYLMALVQYRLGKVREAYRASLEFARLRSEASDEGEVLEQALGLLAEGSLPGDELEDWRMILADCETEIEDGRAMGLRLSRLSEEIEKAVWSGEAERSKASFDRAFARLAGQLGLDAPFTAQQAEEVLFPYVQLLKLAVVEQELEQSWNRRDWGEIADRFLEFFVARLQEQRERFGMQDVAIESQDLLALSRDLPLGVLRPLVYLTTLARFPDHEVVDRIFAERGGDVAVLVAMCVVSLATFLDVRPPSRS